jgi:hypothetical protein
MSNPIDQATADTPPANFYSAAPLNCSASVSRPTWLWMEHSPLRHFSMLLASRVVARPKANLPERDEWPTNA